jgi:hypothetical protein
MIRANSCVALPPNPDGKGIAIKFKHRGRVGNNPDIHLIQSYY